MAALECKMEQEKLWVVNHEWQLIELKAKKAKEAAEKAEKEHKDQEEVEWVEREWMEKEWVEKACRVQEVVEWAWQAMEETAHTVQGQEKAKTKPLKKVSPGECSIASLPIVPQCRA
jgi:hypothetical protein